jgi:hypothetical protein
MGARQLAGRSSREKGASAGCGYQDDRSKEARTRSRCAGKKQPARDGGENSKQSRGAHDWREMEGGESEL